MEKNMISTNPKDSLHKAWLYRLLAAIADDGAFASLRFKGGTCAAMRGFLDRFSVDLDFDYLGPEAEIPALGAAFRRAFAALGLEIKDESARALQFFLKYPNKEKGGRNTLEIDVSYPAPRANRYEAAHLSGIDRVLICQDRPTMFANKLVALIDRFERNGSIAGRDVYDIHHFFVSAYEYNKEVIIERTGLPVLDFFRKLRDFTVEHISDTAINQDLNVLVPYPSFRRIRKTLKLETLSFIDDEISRLEKEDL